VDGNIANHVTQRNRLTLVEASSIKTITIELEDNMHVILATASTTVQQIAEFLSLPHPVSLFCKGIEAESNLPLSDVFGMPREDSGEAQMVARDKKTEEVVELNLIWGTQKTTISLLPETPMHNLADYARFIHKIEAKQNVLFFAQTEDGSFEVLADTIGQYEGDTLVLEAEEAFEEDEEED